MEQDNLEDAYEKEVERLSKAEKETSSRLAEIFDRLRKFNREIDSEIVAIAEEHGLPVDVGYDRQYVPKSFVERCRELNEDDPEEVACELADAIGIYLRDVEYNGLYPGWWENSNC